jgi:predicted nicotinamide N-methyase
MTLFDFMFLHSIESYKQIEDKANSFVHSLFLRKQSERRSNTISSKSSFSNYKKKRMKIHLGIRFLLLTSYMALVHSLVVQSSYSVKSLKKTLLCATDATKITTTSDRHIVDGVVCREIHMDVPGVGTVTVLEATAESQEDLVEMALALEEETVETQILTVGDPYGAVLWPAAWAVAKYILSDQKLPVQELSILELGTGTGLVSLAAAVGGAKKVIATDYEPLALKLTSYAAETFHSKFSTTIETQLLDICDYDQPLPKVDLVVAADIMYEPKTGVAMAHRAVEALQNGSRVIVGDSPGRPGRPAFIKALQELGVEGAKFEDTVGRTCTGPRHDLICGEKSTSVSETPQEILVAIMDLQPAMLLRTT